MPVDLVRDTAISVLLRVFEEGAYLDIALDKALRRRPISDRGRRFLTHLAYGTTRYKLLCDFVLRPLLHEPLEKLPPPIRTILRMGVFQAIFSTQVNFPSMVHTSVDLAHRRGHAGTARLVNAVLRRVPETLDAIRLPGRTENALEYLSVRYSMPAWVVREWIAEHGVDRAEALCQESNVEAPVTLRANTLKTTPKELIAALAKSGIVAEKRTAIPEEVTLEGGYPSLRSALFREGHFLIQDAASMLPPHLLEPQPGDRVLDLCAAPGGKTTHLSQLADGKAQVVALDLNPGRIHLVDENVARWGCARVSAVCGDGKAPPLLPVFDRVLVDAPCTGLGTLRRHPDLKWRVTPESRDQLAREQAALLRSGIRLCKNAGLVVYSVCTTTREETEAVVEAVCKTEAVQPEEGPEWLHRWRTGIGRYQTLPANEGLDGFFLMRLRKAS